MRKLMALAVMALFTATGCESDNPTDNGAQVKPDYSVYFIQDYGYLTGLTGDTVSVELTVKVTKGGKSHQEPVEGISVLIDAFSVIHDGNPNVILSRDTVVTDSDGEASLTLDFVVKKGTEELTFRAEVEGDQSYAWTQITGINRPARMVISTTTHTLIVPQGATARMKIAGQVIDSEGVGIQGLNIAARLERDGGAPYGAISFSSRTNSAGNFEISYSSAGGFGVETVVITSQALNLPETLLEERYRVETVSLQDQIGSLSLYGLPDRVILPPGGESVIILSALVTHLNGTPLPGVNVNFTSSAGVIQSNSLSDSVGFARVVWHTGMASDTAEIMAFITGTDMIATDVIEIVAQNDTPDPVNSISIFADDISLIAGSGGSTTIRAICQTVGRRLADPGTVVGFEILEGGGRFEVDRAVVNERGEASVRFLIGITMGPTRIRAFVDVGGGERVESNDVEVRAAAGEAENLEWEVDDDTLSVGESTEFHLRVTDRYSNPVAGEVIRFASTMGNITPVVVTDAAGEGTVNLSTGVSSGVAEITISWRGRTTMATVTFVAASANSIELSANPLSINPIAGNRSTDITARVLDRNGNPVGRTTTVVFELRNQPAPPEGCVFVNGEQIDSSRTANGVGTMRLTSGTQTGGVLLKAYTWRDEGRLDTVSTIISTIQVVSGPPVALDLDIDPRGVDAGGGIWELSVSIRAYDEMQNPASGDNPVTLTVEPDGIATIAPTRLVNGSARTMLSYLSSSTFEPITIYAEIEGHEGVITARRNYTLPLQRGFLTLAADPQNWMFDRGRPDDTCLVRVWATLRDGHDQLINNAPVIFNTDRARYFWRNLVGGRYTMFFPEPARKYTGIVNQNHNEPPGVATVFLRGRMADFYLDDFTLEVGVHLEAHIDGTDVMADPVTVRMTRH